MLNREQIKDIIPHRDQMLLVDEILEIEPGKRCVGILRIRDDMFWVSGHYPGNPIFPGVLQVEALAQTGAVALLTVPEFSNKVPLFAGINGTRFKRTVRPGDTLRTEVEIIKMRGPIGRGAAKAYVGDELACEAELTFALVEQEKFK